MSDEIEALKEAEYAARQAARAERALREHYIHTKVATARDQAEAEAKVKFDQKIEDLHQLHVQARIALEQAQIDLAESFFDAPFPKGTRFVKWRLCSWPRQWWPEKDVAGVIEAVNFETIHPDIGRRGEPGDYIVRFLKKDGTPSKRYERIHRGHDNKWSLPWHWYPEGTDPNREGER